MTALAWALLAVAGVAAVGNWVAVARERPRGVYVCKPLTLILMIAAAIALDPTTTDAVRTWFVVALVLSLLGDVFLMLPRDAFVPGLASFLLAHVAYIVGLNLDTDGHWWWAVPVAVLVAVIGRRLVRALRAGGHDALVGPVSAYMLTIAVMVASALASGRAVAAVGAVFFMTSDALIGEDRFVRHRAWQPVTIMVTYHLAQALLVISLTR
ncbi:MAG: lysoplasmalogenase [Acidimicrobiia bacterium]